MSMSRPVRRQLGFRTDLQSARAGFATRRGVKRQLLGVFAREWVEPLAHVLKELGTEKAWVVHGHDGLDELTTTGPTMSRCWKHGKVTMREVEPGEINAGRATLATNSKAATRRPTPWP